MVVYAVDGDWWLVVGGGSGGGDAGGGGGGGGGPGSCIHMRRQKRCVDATTISSAPSSENRISPRIHRRDKRQHIQTGESPEPQSH